MNCVMEKSAGFQKQMPQDSNINQILNLGIFRINRKHFLDCNHGQYSWFIDLIITAEV